MRHEIDIKNTVHTYVYTPTVIWAKGTDLLIRENQRDLGSISVLEVLKEELHL